MAERARAAVLVEPRRIEIEEIAVPETGSDDGILKVEATGVCGSDIPYYTGEIQGGMGRMPIILGHEIVGRVDRIGNEAAQKWDLREGDRIIVEEHIPCGHCDLCYAGLHKMCIKRRYGSMSTDVSPTLWGGYADAIYLDPNAVIYKADPKVPAELVTLFIPISNGIYWVQQVAGAGIGSTVVIIGPGQHGIGCCIAAREAGAANIILVGLSNDRERLDLGLQFGATHALESDKENVVDAVRELTGGQMADCVIDVTPGASEPLAMALDLAKVRGTIVQAGFKHFKPLNNFLSDKMFMKELTFKGVWGRSTESVPIALRLIESGKLPLEKLCTHKFDVQDTGRALEAANRENGEHSMHVSVIPGIG